MSGLYRKYVVERTDGDPSGKHEYCDYFVLDFCHDPYAFAAAHAYADACEKQEPELAKDLRSRAHQAGVSRVLSACQMCDVRARVNASMAKQLDAARDVIGKDIPCLMAELESAKSLIAKLKEEHECSHGTTCPNRSAHGQAP